MLGLGSSVASNGFIQGGAPVAQPEVLYTSDFSSTAAFNTQHAGILFSADETIGSVDDAAKWTGYVFAFQSYENVYIQDFTESNFVDGEDYDYSLDIYLTADSFNSGLSIEGDDIYTSSNYSSFPKDQWVTRSGTFTYNDSGGIGFLVQSSETINTDDVLYLKNIEITSIV